MPGPATIDFAKIFRDSGVAEVLDKLDTERVGLKPLKTRIRAIAALLIIAKARAVLACRPMLDPVLLQRGGKNRRCRLR